MYSVGIDTSHRFLVIALIKDDRHIDSIQLDCFKHQSEYMVPSLKEILERNSLQMQDIDNWVLSAGPGSYTGVRIGMTLVKVFGSLEKKNVYTLSTLQLYAGKKDCYVIMDARAKRVYAGRYRDGKPLMDDTVYTNEEMKAIIDSGEYVVGDLSVFGLEDNYDSVAENFVLLKDQWQKVDNVDLLTPVYLKNNEEYLK